MARTNGQHLSTTERQQALHTLQGFLAAGISDRDAKAQIMERYNISERTARSWLKLAYRELSTDVAGDRQRILGLALKRRRLAMARAAKNGDWKTYLQAADSEARLLGLDAPRQTEHLVVSQRLQDAMKVVVEVIQDQFIDEPERQSRFIRALQDRISRALAQKSTPRLALVEAEVVDPAGELERSEGEPDGQG